MPVRKLRPGEKLLGRPPGGRVRPLQPGDLPGDIPPSRTGIISESSRRDLRKRVESETALFQFFLEASPAAIGTFFGGALGLGFGGAGAVPGAVLGGIFGEFIGQETGLTPQSDIGLALAGAGPVAGRVAAPLLRPVARATGKAITSIAPAKAAIARKAVKDAVDEMSSFGARILSKQKGIMRVPASKIYTTVRNLGVQIDPKHSFTLKALDSLEKELIKKGKGFPDVAQALRTIRGVKETLSKESISYGEIISTKQLIGGAIEKARKAKGFKGVKLRTPKLVFKAMLDDLDALAARGKGLKSTGAKLLRKADARAKLEFSVKEFEDGISQNLRFIPQEGSVTLRVNGFRNWLRQITDPTNKAKYNKNFAESFKDDLPEIERRLAELDKIAETLSPGGPGSLIIRGAGASTFSKLLGAGAGGAAGFNIAGELGGAAGALIGASMPEMLTAALLSKSGAALLVRAARMGRGTVNELLWAQIGQVIAQGIKPEVEARVRTGRRGTSPSNTVPIQ